MALEIEASESYWMGTNRKDFPDFSGLGLSDLETLNYFT